MKADPINGPAPMPDKGAQAKLDNPIAREVAAHQSTDNKLEQLKYSGGVPKDNLGARPK